MIDQRWKGRAIIVVSEYFFRMRPPFKVVSDLELEGIRVLYGVGANNSLEVDDFCETEFGDETVRITVKEIGMRKMEFVKAGIDHFAVDIQPRDTPPLHDCVLHFRAVSDTSAGGSESH